MANEQVELPTAPATGKPEGWYPVSTNPNNQAHWDGQMWTATRRWNGAAWVETSVLPPPPSSPLPPPPPPPGAYQPQPGPAQQPGPYAPGPYQQAAPYQQPGPYQVGPYPPGFPRKTNGLAIASLVMSLLVFLLGLGSILAIIFAVRARKQIRESQGTQSGDGLAIAGLVIGIVGLLLAGLAWAVFIAGDTAANTGRAIAREQAVLTCQADAKTILTAIEAYQATNHANPVPPSQWSASTYYDNFVPLTSTYYHGPFITGTPSTSNFVIEYDSFGHVWVEGPGTFSSYDPGQNFDTNPNACNVAAIPGF